VEEYEEEDDDGDCVAAWMASVQAAMKQDPTKLYEVPKLKGESRAKMVNRLIRNIAYD
jgi:hypothetical protein